MSFYTRSRNRELQGDALRHEAFDARLKSVGSAIEVVKAMNQESLEYVQSVMAEVRRKKHGREDIIIEMEKYLESGTYSGGVNHNV